MKILIAPNAFKGSLSAAAAAKSIELGVKVILPDCEVVTLLVADGGDGFVQALEQSLLLHKHFVNVSGPLGKIVQASFLYSPQKQTAIIEMANSSGLALLEKNELDPMLASSFGVGEQIIAALNLGAKHFIIGIGGSASSDGGTGMATALGVRFLDDSDVSLVGNAKNLSEITRIDLSELDCRLANCTFDVACDVNNFLLGDEGAAQVYSPQKGASSEQVLVIEKGLSHLANLIERDLGVAVREVVGGGAAGGLGAGIFAFLGAQLKPGAELLLDMQGFDACLENADLVITTEGKLDKQTGFGKAPFVVAKRSEVKNVPTIIICGQVGLSELELKQSAFLKAYSLCEESLSESSLFEGNASIEYSISHADELLAKRTQEAVLAFVADY